MGRTHTTATAIAIAVAAAVGACGAGGQTAAASAAAACRATGPVVVRGPQALVWHVKQTVRTARGHDTYDVYDACEPPSGHSYVMYKDDYSEQLAARVAGHFVAYTTGGQGGEDLSVFDAASGRTRLDEQVDLSGGSEPYEPGPLIGYVLSSNGWLAWVDTLGDPPGSAQALFAQGAGAPLLLDVTQDAISGLTLSGTTLRWQSAAGSQSATLGPSLQPATRAPAAPATACLLITSADALSALDAPAGSGVSAMPAAATTTCTYATSGAHPVHLTVTEKTGLDAAAVKAADQAYAGNPSYMQFQLADSIPFGHDAYFGGTGLGTMVTWQGATQVTITLAGRRVDAAALERVAFLALRRLGWPVAARVG